MKRKLGLIVSTIFCVFSVLCVPILVQAEEQEGLQTATENTYFEGQLNEKALKFYTAMEELNTKEDGFKTGKGEVELSETLGQDLLRAYVGGDPALAKDFQAARDAFTQDHEEIFYVDFTKLTFRVGMQNGAYVAFINNGSNENYYAAGFASAEDVDAGITAAAAEKKKIIDSVNKKIESQPGKISVEETVARVHEEVIKRMDYEHFTKENSKVAGVYGALVHQKGNCEGYSKSMKWILDDLGIPSILVSGTGVNSRGDKEAHMWNYVQIDGQWYAVDATWDDPIMVSKEDAKTLAAGTINTRYLLRGSDSFNQNHMPYGEFSNGSKVFGYPELNPVDYQTFMGSESEDISTDLKVYSQRGEEKEGTQYTVFMIDYQGKSLEELEKEGIYLACRLSDTGYNNGMLKPWAYLGAASIDKSISPIRVPSYHTGTIQFAFTKIKYTAPTYDVDLSLEGNNVAIAKSLKVPYPSGKTSPPFLRQSWPTLTKSIGLQRQHYEVEFDEKLIYKEGETVPKIEVENSQPFLNYSVDNVKKLPDREVVLPDGLKRMVSVIEFDFYPDTTYQGYANVYKVWLKNLVSEKSGLEPSYFNIRTTFPMSVPCAGFVAPGTIGDAFVIASPTLVVDDGMDIFEYKDDPNRHPGALDIRLVASIPSEKEENAMLDSIGEAGSIKSSATFDLSLSCVSQAVKLKSDTDYHVTIGIPYPPGFNYNDQKNVQFKAYHYVKQADGSYKAEELVCRITPQGLEVIAERFSPFSVVAMEADPNGAEKEYKVIDVSRTTEGGVIKTTKRTTTGDYISAAGLYTLNADNNTETFTVQADEGYVIDKVIVDGNEVPEASGQATFKQSFSFNNIRTMSEVNTDEDANTLKVSFIAESVKVKDEENQITPEVPVFDKQLTPVLDHIAITTPPSKTKYVVGDSFDKTGMIVTANYTDGSSKLITKYTVSEDALETVGEKTINISYTEGTDPDSIKKEATQIVEVEKRSEEKVLTEIKMTKAPANINYEVGETFDSKGMEVQAYYLNGDTKSLTDEYKLDEKGKSDWKTVEIDKADKKDVMISYQETKGGPIRYAKCPINVIVPVTGIEADDSNVPKEPLNLNEKTKLSVKFQPENATNKKVNWETSNPEIATVNQEGVVTGVSTGDATITATIKESSKQARNNPPTATFKVKVSKTLASIAITKKPDKAIYLVGDSFDATGMVVDAVYQGGSIIEIPKADYKVEPEGPLGRDDSQVTITYTQDGKDWKVTQAITVNEKATPGIAIKTEPDKLDYTEGETFDPTGLVITVTDANGTTEVTYSDTTKGDFSFSPLLGEALTVDNDNVVITYGGMSENQAITVTGKKVTSIAVKSAPARLVYAEGEMFDPAGLVLTVTDANGTVEVAYGNSTQDQFSFTPLLTEGLTEDINNVVIGYGGATANQAITVTKKTVTAIAVKSPPSKLTYFEGEKFDPRGLVITATDANQTVDVIYDDSTKGGFSFTPSLTEGLTVNNNNIVIIYGGESAEQAITVAEKPVTGIAVKSAPVKLTYTEGEMFDPTGLGITVTYDSGPEDVIYDDTTKELFSFTPSLTEGLTVLNNTIVITYGGKSITQEIAVKEKTVTGIAVKSAPVKLAYTEGETFDPAGLAITVTYDTGTEDVTYDDTTKGAFSFTPSLTEGLTVLNNAVVITYGGTSTKQEITVVEQIKTKSLTGIEIKTPPKKTAYKVGEHFDKTDMVVAAVYNDGSSNVITDYSISPAGILNVKDTTITISYVEAGITKTATQSISVTAGAGGTNPDKKANSSAVKTGDSTSNIYIYVFILVLGLGVSGFMLVKKFKRKK